MSSRRREPRSIAGLAAGVPVRRAARALSRTTTVPSGAASLDLERARERAAGFFAGTAFDFRELEVTRFFDKKWPEK